MQHYINEKQSVEVVQMMELYNSALQYSRDLTWLISDQGDDRNSGIDGGNSLKVEALETDLFVQSVQMRR